METIVIMAKALIKASGMQFMRLDIQYNEDLEETAAYLYLTDDNGDFVYRISENGNCEQRT